jgi:hypothetical protein
MRMVRQALPPPSLLTPRCSSKWSSSAGRASRTSQVRVVTILVCYCLVIVLVHMVVFHSGVPRVLLDVDVLLYACIAPVYTCDTVARLATNNFSQ